jgi:hypothetical protein
MRSRKRRRKASRKVVEVFILQIKARESDDFGSMAAAAVPL